MSAALAIPRQRRLPTSKAIEIAWKQIRVRLGRSLLVTSGIVLAIAFLVSLQTNEVLADGMRRWIATATPGDHLAAQTLAVRLADNGVPTDPHAIAQARLQARWLLGLALLVAFVGILNAMLMSVTERFREIGTMKCLGALDSFIVKLFLIESLFQGIAGTAIGLVLGTVVSGIVTLLNYGRLAFAGASITGLIQAWAISASIGVLLTVVGAIWPAWQAARMQPVEAMRAET